MKKEIQLLISEEFAERIIAENDSVRLTADAGYESKENYTYFENKGQACYIKPQNYERSKTRKFKNILLF